MFAQFLSVYHSIKHKKYFSGVRRFSSVVTYVAKLLIAELSSRVNLSWLDIVNMNSDQ